MPILRPMMEAGMVENSKGESQKPKVRP